VLLDIIEKAIGKPIVRVIEKEGLETADDDSPVEDKD